MGAFRRGQSVSRTGASDQQRQASDPRLNAWVAANAGSGKTRVLVDRVIRLLLDGAKPQTILCLTFTKAAAAEMANRLFDVLGKWITLDDAALADQLRALGVEEIEPALLDQARKLFTRSLETPGGLKIQTIHAFSERLLQLFPVEAGVAPGFEVMDERAAEELLVLARDAVLARAQSDIGNPYAQALAKIISFVKEDSFDTLLQGIIAKRSELSHILGTDEGVAIAISALRASLGRSADLTEADIAAAATLDDARYRAFAAALQHGSDKDGERADLILGVLATPEASLDMLARLYLTTEQAPKKLSFIATKAVITQADWIAEFVAMEQERLLGVMAARSDLAMLDATGALLTLAAAITRRYEDEKRSHGHYDFDDLIARTRQLLTRSGAAQWVLYKLDGGIDHILIDEAQDTSPAQWEIVEALAEEFFAGRGARPDIERTFFAVGDRKQSIFSFQGADPDAFVQAATRFELKIRAGGKIFKRIPLHISYRSTRPVLQSVDLVFAVEAARRGVEARIDTTIEHRAHREGDHGLVEIWPLVAPDEKIEEQPWRAPIDTEPQNHPRRKLAAKIARRVAGWIGRRQLPSLGRAVKAGDILILVQRRNGFFDALIRELRRQGVAVAGADRLKLGEHLAIRDVLALAQFTLMPEDDYTLACVLKSPLVSRNDGAPVDDGDLFELAYARGRASLWERLCASDDQRFGNARAYLETWLANGPSLSPFAFFSQLLVASRKNLLQRLGPEANDPLDALLDIAIDFERSHPPTLQAFLTWFASAETEIKRDMDQGADEVRVMTAHGAKGLESHIVILPDTADLPDNRRRPPVLMVRPVEDGPAMPFWVLPKMARSATVQSWCDARLDSAGDEYRRLLYVAMTRARDELYICGWYNRSEPKPECWYELMRGAIIPHASPRVDEDGDTVWRIGSGDTATTAPVSAEAQREPLPAWLSRPIAAPAPETARPSRFSKIVHGPRGLREARIARGRIIHRLLQMLPELPEAARLPAALRLAERAGFGKDVAAATVNLIKDGRYAAYFSSPSLAEVPLMLRSPDGGALAGQIDRLLVTDAEVLILDFKSDATPPARPTEVGPAYLAQLAGYRTALRNIYPTRKVRAALLWTEIPSLMELPDALLDNAAMQEMRIPAGGSEP